MQKIFQANNPSPPLKTRLRLLVRNLWRVLFPWPALAAALTVLLLLGLPQWAAHAEADPRAYSAQSVPVERVGIVFGAGITPDDTPTLVLRDRLDMAIQLYQTGKVSKLLMSGDNRTLNHNEPGVMQAYAVQKGVPAEDIVLDYAGNRTYDTCYRARHIFNIHTATLITQKFHLPRALFTCANLGIDVHGVAADKSYFSPPTVANWQIRELFATSAALWQVWVERPLPILGKNETF